MKDTAKTIFQKLISAILIILMLSSYFPMLTLANDGETENTEDYITLDVNWKNTTNVTEGKLEGKTENSYGFQYNLKFNGVPTGFQNVVLSIKDSETTLPVQISTNGKIGSYARVEFGNQNTGVELNNEGSIIFKKNDTAYEKEIVFRVEASYIEPIDGETKTYVVEKRLEANVTPETQTTNFNAVIDMQKDSNNLYYKDTQISKVKHDMSEYNSSLGWYATELTTIYPIHIEAYTHTQTAQLVVTINRIVENESKMAQGYTIDWDGLDSDTLLGTPTQKTNDDGSVTYTFTKGTYSDTFVKENTFSINNDFNVAVTYPIPNTNPEDGGTLNEENTKCFFKAELNATGFKIEKEYNKEEVIAKEAKNSALNKENSTALAQYTPGNHAWIHVNLDDSSYLEKEDIENLISKESKGSIDLTFNATINNDYNWGDTESCDGYINFAAPQITYLSDDGEIIRRELTASEMRLKSVKPNMYQNENSAIKFNEQEIDFSSEYSIAQGTNVNVYSIKMRDFLLSYYRGFQPTYTLNANELRKTGELGLSEAELENILSISVDITTSGDWCEGYGTGIYYNTNSLGNKYSYMEVEIPKDNDFSTDITNLQQESKTLKIRMYKNTNVIRTKELSVVNENPVFYVQLPSMFKYSGRDFEVTSNNTQISIDKISLVRATNKEQYLVIYCEGTYDSSVTDEIDINVTYKRTLNNDAPIGRQWMNVYMLTDNERYFNESSNSLQLKKGTDVPEKIMRTQLGFDILAGDKIQAHTKLEDKLNIKYTPNPADEVLSTSEITMPLVMDKDDTVTIRSELECQGDTLSNISLLARLPKVNSTYTDNTSLKLIADDYELPDEFYANYGDSLNKLQKGEIVPQIDLTNIQNLQVYLKTGKTETIVDSSKYTIYYTTTADVTIDTDISEYQEYTEGADLSQAKNIKVVFAGDLIVAEGQTIGLKYDATMPDAIGMSAATTAVQYTKSDGETSTLGSPAAYVVNGNTTGSIKVTKKFEGYNIGVAPNGVNLSGIEFKLKYYDETTNENKFLQDENGNDIVATTNENAVATFTNIPYGEYYLYEVSTFDRFDGIGDIYMINILPGETVKITAENPIKHGDIIINKLWEDTDIQQGKVTFKLEKQKVGTENIPYDAVYATTNEQGVAIALNVPYGTYKVTEVRTVDGWYADITNSTVELNAETAETTVTNKISKGILQIVKTVPEKEKVEGLKFHISGLGKVNYINKNGEEVLNNTDLEVTIGEDYSSDEDITIELQDKIQDNYTKAIITIKNLPLGYYHVEEIDMPKVEGTDIEKYVTASAETELTVKDETKTVNIKNQYKYGYIQINKTAKLKEGDTYTDIGDLSQFEVRITGTSYYGNAVDKTIQLDEDGYAITKVEIGKYTITEVAKEGYTTYYGEDATASTTPPEVTVDYNKTTIQKLYNEHTGVGYVRVEKTLEGVTDPETVKDAKIKFVVVGKNAAGGSVESEIKIDQIDIVKNVAYGVSEAISAGGEYELREVESTIPNFYEGIEPVVVDIKTAHTQEAPLVINAVDPRTKGNLEIITKTYPEGGPLFGITYRVTEVKINQDGTYTKIGTPKELAGNNDLINTSFAEMKDIYAGYYLVEQLTVPDGWIMDLPQIVEVPSYNTGYATFEITKKEKLKENKVTINKVILNSNNEVATAEEIAKAKLNEKESFEIKIKNVDTLEEYYAFASTEKPGIIQGIEAGTYTIEEVYKPKYTTEGYYNHITVAPNGDLAQLNIPSEIVEEKIVETEGKYLFTITEDENGVAQNVTLTVKNKINTNFGFGGQDLADNYSLVDYEEQQIQTITKAVIYVVDENNNAISGAKFKLVNSEGSVVSYGNKTEFEVNDKKLTIRGLDVGKYTLVCTAYPDGYLKPDDKEITVYSDAVEVARVEIQKNVPRGSLKLSTVYKTDENETKYTSRSKYKVVDKDTGELLTFQRTATGDYKKSNLPDASPVIVLKSGAVEVEGIEVGNYEVGIVDVTKGYGIQKTLPEEVSVVENDTQNVSVEVVKKKVVQVEAGEKSNMYLTEGGELYVIGEGHNGIFGNGTTYYTNCISQFMKIEFGEGVKIAKFTLSDDSAIAIDTEGRVWSWGKGYYGALGNGSADGTNANPICITNIANSKLAEAYNKGTRILDVSIDRGIGILLDNEGKVWTSGYTTGDGTTNTNVKTSFECITDIQGHLHDAYEKGIKIKKIATMNGTANKGGNRGLIDTLGKVWVWGTNPSAFTTETTSNVLSPICISETTDLNNVEIEQLVITNSHTMALDSNGSIWLWGSGSLNILNGTSSLPTKLDSSYFGNAKIKYIDSTNESVAVVDEFGKVWTWGSGNSLGTGSTEATTTPTCISDEETEVLYGKEIEQISMNEYEESYTLALDKLSTLWTWGMDYTQQEAKQNYYPGVKTLTPVKITVAYEEHLEYNVKFKDVHVGQNNNCYAIDEEGQLWVWGYNYNKYLGINTYDVYYNDSILNPMKLELPGNPKIKKIVSANSSILALSEDGRLFIWGPDAVLGNGTPYNSTSILPTEITNSFNLKDDVQIVDICRPYNNVMYALDSEGKVYTWSRDYISIECMSDDENEVLKDVNVVELTTGANSVIARDDKGKIYYWNYSSPNQIIELNVDGDVKFVKAAGSFLIDDKGKLWGTSYYTSYNTIECLSDNTTYEFYKNHQLDSDYKIIDMYVENEDIHSSNNVILKDFYGNLWHLTDYSSWSFSISKFEEYLGYTEGVIPREIISLSGHLLVDKYGQIWVYKMINNSYGEAGNGTTNTVTQPFCMTNPEANLNNEPVFKANNTLINVPVDNGLKGIKVKELVNDTFVIDENDNVWYFTSSGKAINLTETHIGDKNPLYGKEIVEVIENGYVKTSDNKIYYISDEFPRYVMDLVDIECEYILNYYSELGKECYVALDKNGNIWTCGVNGNGLLGNGKYTTDAKPVCLNAIEGTAVYEEELKDSNFKFEKVEVLNGTFYSRIIAIDNLGRLWSWGNYYCGNGGTYSEVISSPMCLNYIEETDLNTAYVADNTLKFETIIGGANDSLWSAIDNSGNTWKIDSTTNTLKIDNSTTSTETQTPYIPSYATGDLRTEFENNPEFSVVQYFDNYSYDKYGVVLGNNGKVYYYNEYNKEHRVLSDFNNVNNIYQFTSFYTQDTYWRTYLYQYIVLTDDGMYNLNCYVYYSRTTNKIDFEDAITTSKTDVGVPIGSVKYGNDYFVLDSDGKLWSVYQATDMYVDYYSMTDDTQSYWYNKEIESIGEFSSDTSYIDGTGYIVEGDGTVIAWGRFTNNSEYHNYTEHDDIITTIYGEATKENKLKFLEKLNSSMPIVQKVGDITYVVRYDGSKVICTNLVKEYINGLGRINQVVGENEVKTEEGKIYRIIPEGTLSYIIEETTTTTLFATPEVEEKQIEGANIVKQTTYKALDDAGKLYVWDDYTGISNTFEGVLCLTDEQYYIAPIYSKSNGWSVIKNQF